MQVSKSSRAKNVLARLKSRRRKDLQLARVSFRVPRPMSGGRGELKSVDIPFNGITFPLNAAAVSVPLCLLSNGSAFYNRVGRKVRLHSIQFRGYVTSVLLAVNTTNEQLRLIIGYDKQPNGASITWAPLIADVTQAGAINFPATGGLNLSARDRIEIIRDKVFNMPGRTAAGIYLDNFMPDSDQTKFEFFAKLGGRDQVYQVDSAPAVIGDLATGNLFLAIQGNIGAQYALDYDCRVRYYDA